MKNLFILFLICLAFVSCATNTEETVKNEESPAVT